MTGSEWVSEFTVEISVIHNLDIFSESHSLKSILSLIRSSKERNLVGKNEQTIEPWSFKNGTRATIQLYECGRDQGFQNTGQASDPKGLIIVINI